jgi:glycosyltransferase involved in cell wall biosynthesis
VTAVHVIVPEGIDDPARPSGGNTFDRRVSSGLAARGWRVHVHRAPGGWPRPDEAAIEALAARIRAVPDGGVVLLDGLVASAAPEVLVPEADRLRLVALVHMPLGQEAADEWREREAAALSAATSVIATSAWTRRFLVELYALAADRVHVAEPGVDAAALAPGTETAGALLSVGAVTATKGQDVLLDALATLGRDRWRCVCVGSLERDAAFAERLLRRVHDSDVRNRVRFAGPQTQEDLARSYRAADVLVVPSRAETYGMVVTEALARGLPVIAADVGGIPEALGHGSDGDRPGLLVPPGDPRALGDAIREWLEDGDLRLRLRRAARARRSSLSSWSVTTSVVADVLAGAAR